MKSFYKLVLLAAAVAATVSCSKSRPEQMQMAENVKIECQPSVLEAVGNDIPVTIKVTYPKDYFHPEAVMVVTPVLVYEGGTQTSAPYTYQGDNVKDNNKVIPSAGGSVIESFSFRYVEGMEKSYLELRSVAFYGTKRIEIPAVKVADGLRVNGRIADARGAYKYKDDGYQEVVRQTTEGRILYDVNSSSVKPGELRSRSIKELKDALSEIIADDRYKVTGTRIEAYASPEGGQDLNAKLSDKRAESAQKAWDSISKGLKADELQVKSIGQDWEGFQEAVANSNIEDKELILRVLSMYSDPAVREREIKNMSQVYTEINNKVFPELRRARFITEVEYKNFTDAELQELSERAIGMLSEEALLRVAANSSDINRKSMLYQLASEKFGSQKAVYNLAALALDEDKPGVAEVYVGRLKDSDPEAENIKGIVALRRGNLDEAEKFFKNSSAPEAKENLGLIALMRGDWKTAESCLAGSGSYNEALTYLINGDTDKASATLKDDSAKADYLRAIIAARKGDAASVKSYLDSAGAKDPSLKARAAKDIEFANYR